VGYWAANQLFTRNAISLVMKFRRDIAQQDDRMGNNAGAKKMASRYDEQLQDRVSPLAASHPILSQPVSNVRYKKQIQVCTSPCVASRPRSGNQPGDEDASINTNKWIVVGKKGSNQIDSTTKAAPKVEVHNAYSILSPTEEIPTNEPTTTMPHANQATNVPIKDVKKEHKQTRRARICQHRQETLRRLKESEELFFDTNITLAKDKQTVVAKEDTSNARRVAIDSAHTQQDKPRVGLMQQGQNMIHSVGSAFNRTLKIINKAKHVQFKLNTNIRIIKDPNVVMMTYDSGADGTYISKRDRVKAGLPILRQSSKKVRVANGDTVKAEHITKLPFPQLSAS
jgi:hypothetical protein